MADLEQLLKASAAGDAAAVRAILGAAPELATASTMLGSQPIHAAHFAGRKDIVELLLATGVQMNAHRAAQLGLVDTLKQFLDSDAAELGWRNARGATLLTDACYWGQVEAARLLLDRGADPNQPSADGFLDIRPLGAAVATPDTPNPSDNEDTAVALVTLLLDRGAEVNGQRKDGLTALHGAAYRGHLKVIRVLIDSGADRSVVGLPGCRHAGQSAADLADDQGQAAAAELLRDG